MYLALGTYQQIPEEPQEVQEDAELRLVKRHNQGETVANYTPVSCIRIHTSEILAPHVSINMNEHSNILSNEKPNRSPLRCQFVPIRFGTYTHTF